MMVQRVSLTKSWQRCTEVAFLLGLAACSHPAPRETVHDLAALLPVAEVRREVRAIDFGSTAGREHLVSGWYRNERGRDGASFVWSRGGESVVELFLGSPRDLRVEIRCASVPTPDGQPQSMRVDLNGHDLGTVTVAPEMRDSTIELPRAALVAGSNRLTFRYRVVTAPRRDNGHRELAVRWDVLRIRPARQHPPVPRAVRGGLFLPFGSEVVFYVDVHGGGELALPGIEGRGGDGRLAVSARTEGGRAEQWKAAPGRSRSFEIPGSGDRLVRLAIRSLATVPGADGGILVSSPAVRAERSARPQRDGAVRPRPWSGRPNVIIYLVDALRRDRLGCYGAARPTSPSVDAFARGATLFEHAVAQATWTRPAVTSVLTGLEPLAHGVRTLDDRLADEAVTLPELLQAAGYLTAAFSTNPHVSAATGLAQGFDDFQLLPEGRRSSEDVNRRVLRWLDGHAGGAPFFLYVHALDPHAPYAPPVDMMQRFAPGVVPGAGAGSELIRAYAAKGEERARRIAGLSALYDGEVAANDRSFGELVAELRRRGLYEKTLLVFVADHGEEFDEHGFLGHANNLYAPTLSVPLIVKWPRQTRGERVPGLAQQIDLMPTVLRAAGLSPPAGLRGHDLFTLGAGHRAFSHLSYQGREGVSVSQGVWKLILPMSRKLAPGPELYRRDTDPGERENLLTRDDVRAGWLLAQVRLELLRTRTGLRAGRAEIDEETRKALAALGYL
jgi:arylsulfatase A-like enzyme